MNNNEVGEVDKNKGPALLLHSYLQFEDFSSRGEGLETYLDGGQVSIIHWFLFYFWLGVRMFFAILVLLSLERGWFRVDEI